MMTRFDHDLGRAMAHLGQFQNDMQTILDAVKHQGYYSAPLPACPRTESVPCRLCDAKDICTPLAEWASELQREYREDNASLVRETEAQGLRADKLKADLEGTRKAWKIDRRAYETTIAKQVNLIEALRELVAIMNQGRGHVLPHREYVANKQVQDAERALDGTEPGEPRDYHKSDETWQAEVDAAQDTMRKARERAERAEAQLKNRTETLDDLRKKHKALTIDRDKLIGDLSNTIAKRDKLAKDLAKMTTKKDQYFQWYNDKINAYQLQSAHVDELGAKIATANATIARLVAEQEAKQ